ncbi:MAG: HAMP domain-containing histidine kinase, partial [Pseudonocardia sp.]|nr:HAMP domain-containing histidine kinase [Pseudonocardia sp.]
RRAAAAADRLASGDRNIEVRPEGPTEVARLAHSLNTLTSALHTSEARQREFLLSVSHELRTPLTAVKGYAEALADRVVTGDAAAEAGRTVLAESTRLERLVNDLLDLARSGTADFPIDIVPVNLTAIMTEAAEVWSTRCAESDVTLRTELPDMPHEAHTDPTRLRQIVDGLMENALRVTPAGAPIVLAMRRDPDNAKDLLVEVRDGGPGLTPEDRAVAFQRFALYQRYRGVRQVGTGLGLALVHTLATRIGATASADAAPEGGASFRIRLPATPDS